MRRVSKHAPSAWQIVRLSFFLGWQDIRLMYRRTVLGQFWITISMTVTFVAIGAIFGLIFKSPVIDYMPFLACGLVFFTFLGGILNEGATSFIGAESFIKQSPLPPIIYYLRSVWKNGFLLLHNAVALVALFLFFPQGISGATFLVIPGVAIAMLGMAGLGLALAMASTRFRDVPQMIAAAVQVFFYITPILWLPTALPPEAQAIVLPWNPFYHYLEIMRQPLLNVYPSAADWASALAFTVTFVALGIGAYWWKYRRLAFWV